MPSIFVKVLGDLIVVEICLRHFDIKGKLPSHFVKVLTDLIIMEIFLKKYLYTLIGKVAFPLCLGFNRFNHDGNIVEEALC